MSNYELDRKWLASNGDEVVTFGRNTFTVSVTSQLSQKVLGKLYALGKAYVMKDGEVKMEEPAPKPMPKTVKKSKKKKITIDEPTEESPTEETGKEESDLSEEGES
jgi:hypothetical protein